MQDEIREKFHAILDLIEKYVPEKSHKRLDLVEKLLDIELSIRDHMKKGENNT